MLICRGFSEKMYEDGYKKIMNIDFSEVVINTMQKKCKDLVGLECMYSSNPSSSLLILLILHYLSFSFFRFDYYILICFV